MLPVGATPINCAGIEPEHIVWFALIDPTVNTGLTVIVTTLVGSGPLQAPEAFCCCLK